MFNVIDLSGGSCSNAPAIPDSKIIKDANNANMALKSLRLLTLVRRNAESVLVFIANITHVCEYNWKGKLLFSVLPLTILTLIFLMVFLF